MIILVQKSCLHNDCKRNQSRTKIPYYAVVCFKEAAIFSQSPSTPPGCDVGYGEREFQRQLSASRLLLCFFWSCISIFNGTLYSHCPCRTSQPCSIEIYFDIWQMAASYMARIPQSRRSSCGSNSAYIQSLHKHDFISNQLLFYCWLTQQHFNFSVSFSFKTPSSAHFLFKFVQWDRGLIRKDWLTEARESTRIHYSSTLKA